MEINATLIGQLLTFSILVWFTLRFVWPPITGAMQERAKKIAAGLEAAERSQRELKQAESKILDMLKQAKKQASEIVQQANMRAGKIVEEGREAAQLEGQQIIKRAEEQINNEVIQTKEALRQQLAGLAIAGAGKILRRQLDESSQVGLLDEFVAEI